MDEVLPWVLGLVAEAADQGKDELFLPLHASPFPALRTAPLQEELVHALRAELFAVTRLLTEQQEPLLHISWRQDTHEARCPAPRSCSPSPFPLPPAPSLLLSSPSPSPPSPPSGPRGAA